MKRIILSLFVYSLKCVNRNSGFLLPVTMKKMYDLWIIGVCVYNKLCDSFSKTVSEFIINDVIPFMAFCAEIWQQKRLRFPLEVAAFSLYTDDSYLICYREIDMSCCNIVLSLRTDQSWLYVTVHVIHSAGMLKDRLLFIGYGFIGLLLFCLQIYNIKRALSSPDRNNPLNSEKVSCLEINIGYVFLAFFKSFQRLLG